MCAYHANISSNAFIQHIICLQYIHVCLPVPKYFVALQSHGLLSGRSCVSIGQLLSHCIYPIARRSLFTPRLGHGLMELVIWTVPICGPQLQVIPAITTPRHFPQQPIATSKALDIGAQPNLNSCRKRWRNPLTCSSTPNVWRALQHETALLTEQFDPNYIHEEYDISAFQPLLARMCNFRLALCNVRPIIFRRSTVHGLACNQLTRLIPTLPCPQTMLRTWSSWRCLVEKVRLDLLVGIIHPTLPNSNFEVRHSCTLALWWRLGH